MAGPRPPGPTNDPNSRLQRLELTLAGLYQAIGECGIQGIVDTSKDMTDSQLSGVGDVLPAPTAAVGRTFTDAVGRVKILAARCPGRSHGWASVMVTEESITTLEATHTQKLILHVDWRTKRGGGTVVVDCTRGCCFAIPALESIDIYAQNVRALGFGGHIAGPTKRVNAMCHWGTSISPNRLRHSSESLSLLAGVAQVVEIPRFARDLLVMTDTFANLAALTVTFQSGLAAGRIYETTNPNANGTPVVAGAEFASFTSTGVAQIITPVWDLWL